jgi:hypothetical protein
MNEPSQPLLLPFDAPPAAAGRGIRPRRFLALALLPLLPVPLADEIAHAPEEGLVLVRTFETTGTAELTGVSFVLQGEEHAPDELPEVTFESLERFVLRDELAEVADGRVTRILRTYVELLDQSETSSPEADDARERASELEGESVIFDWDADDEEWSAAGEDDDLDEDLLEGLVADLSFAVFLPPGEVEEDDSWDVPVSAFALIFAPGGNLHLAVEDAEADDAEQRAELTAALIDAFEGSITAIYRGTREEDGVAVAVIELEIDIEAEAALPGSEEVERTLELTRELEGELLWHQAEKRMLALHLEGETTESIRTEGTLEGPDGSEVELTQTETIEGTKVYRFTVEGR